MKKAIVLLISLLFVFACGKKEEPAPYNGHLAGTVKYTGASNMEVDNVIITLHKIGESSEKGSWRITQSGTYNFELPSGKYVLNLEGNRCYSKNLPETVEVKVAKTTSKDINIERLPYSVVVFDAGIEIKQKDTVKLNDIAALDIRNSYSINKLDWKAEVAEASWIKLKNGFGTIASQDMLLEV